ncbi:MAG: sigma-E factor negative regulatory protein [Steroidobacteraceae bacterium]
MTDAMLPNETLPAQLSAFIDDELPGEETDLFVRRLVKETDLKQAMSRYQLIGEALRAPASATHLSRDFSARVAAALEQDSAAAAKSARVATLPAFQLNRWLKPAAGMAVAAGVAMVAVLTVRNQGEVGGQMTASTLQPVTTTAQKTANSYVVPVASNAPTAMIPASRLTNYIVAHSEFSSPLGRSNMVPGLLAEDQAMEVETEEAEAASE